MRRTIDELATTILERAVLDLREGRISCESFSFTDGESFGFAASFVAGDSLDAEAPAVQSLDAEPVAYRSPRPGDRCPKCAGVDVLEAGDRAWVCLACNYNWHPFGGASEG